MRVVSDGGGERPRARSLVWLLTNLVAGFAALTMLFLIFSTFVNRYFQQASHRAVRHAFTVGAGSANGVDYIVTCPPLDAARGRLTECDPLAVKGAGLYRSGRCSETAPHSFLGNRWECMAKFKDGSTLALEVSVRLRSRHLRLLLPVREPGT
jgi:hypothetical protein